VTFFDAEPFFITRKNQQKALNPSMIPSALKDESLPTTFKASYREIYENDCSFDVSRYATQNLKADEGQKIVALSDILTPAEGERFDFTGEFVNNVIESSNFASSFKHLSNDVDNKVYVDKPKYKFHGPHIAINMQGKIYIHRGNTDFYIGTALRKLVFKVDESVVDIEYLALILLLDDQLQRNYFGSGMARINPSQFLKYKIVIDDLSSQRQEIKTLKRNYLKSEQKRLGIREAGGDLTHMLGMPKDKIGNLIELLLSSESISEDDRMMVKAIDDNSIVITPSTDLVGETIPVGAYIQLYGCRGSNGTNGFDGLEDFIPTIGDRTGTAWDTYIATAFRGIDRSEAVNRLAGQFVKAANSGSHPLTDALMALLKKTKRKGGGSNNQLILNDEDFDAIQKEADLVRSFFTNTDGNVKAKKNATFGLSDFSVAFGDATLGDTIVDPFCTYGKVYSLDKGDLKFYDIGNMGRVISPVSNGEIGKYDIESVWDQGIGNDPKVSLNTDKLFTVTPGTSGEFGPQFTIAANLFGNFKLEKTASSGVAVLR
jgi:hypothetical protein